MPECDLEPGPVRAEQRDRDHVDVYEEQEGAHGPAGERDHRGQIDPIEQQGGLHRGKSEPPVSAQREGPYRHREIGDGRRNDAADRDDGDPRCERHQSEDDRTEAPTEHGEVHVALLEGEQLRGFGPRPPRRRARRDHENPDHLGLHGRERELRVPPVEAVLDHHEPDRDREQSEDDAEAACDHVRRRASEPVGEEGGLRQGDRDRRGVGRRARGVRAGRPPADRSRLLRYASDVLPRSRAADRPCRGRRADRRRCRYRRATTGASRRHHRPRAGSRFRAGCDRPSPGGRRPRV